jgi:hypothetical protein
LKLQEGLWQILPNDSKSRPGSRFPVANCDSLEKILISGVLIMESTPLTGIDLLNCAQANAKEGLDAASQHCGYGSDSERFMAALQEAAHNKGITLKNFSDLLNFDDLRPSPGEAIAPESPGEL